MTRTRGIMAIMLAAAVWANVPAAAGEVHSDMPPVTDAMLQEPNAADWPMFRRTLDSWGYSPLAEINKSNADELRLVWARGLPEGFQEGTPLVYDGILYFPGPDDVIQALDAVTGELIWEHRRRLPEDLDEHIRAAGINRNIAVYDRLIIGLSADGHVYALDAESGEVAWDTEVHDHKGGIHQTSGPIIADGKVISGRGCARYGPAACVITAHDAKTGAELWRRRTIPRPDEPGGETWGNVPDAERNQVGTWYVPSYDPELDLIFIGTSVTQPAPKFLLGGNDRQHLYHNSTLALDPDTGEIVWHYQHLVDHWDLDHVFERLLVDTVVAPDPEAVAWINPDLEPGKRYKVITGIPGKTGVVYTLDRETGEFLWATPTIRQNVVAEIDGDTGRVHVNPETVFEKTGDKVFICPSGVGGKNWPAGAYSPLTNMMYYPLQNTCSRMTAIAEDRSPDMGYGLARFSEMAEGFENLGTVYAVSAETGRITWTFATRTEALSLLTTGGGLLFGGDGSGRFRALDQETGDVVWTVNLGASVTGFPVTFAVDGKQYVAVSTGTAAVTGGWRRLTPGVKPSSANNLFVFALP